MPLSYSWDWDIQKPINPDRDYIKKVVCDEFGITIPGLSGSNKTRQYMDARCVYSYLTRKYLKDTFRMIGEQQNRDHASIINQLRRIDDLIYVKDPIIERIRRIEKTLKSTNNAN